MTAADAVLLATLAAIFALNEILLRILPRKRR